MKTNKIPLILLVILFAVSDPFLPAQNTFHAIILDKETWEPLPGANVLIEGTPAGASANDKGIVILKNIPDGKYTLEFSYVGYQSFRKEYSFPQETNLPDTILLVSGETLESVVVKSFRTNNHIETIPTRVEVLGLDEIKEETKINPGNISKLLGETSGIRVQQTSAVSGNVSFRIQGLPGKYTQLLQDGFPLYGGFSSGLSLLQIPPLDLQQVEVIRGSASTLYGGSAIAGIVNLISKQPDNQPEFKILLNQTHKGGQDISTWFARKTGKFGITLLAAHNTQKPKDVSGNGFTDIPEYHRSVLSPRFFYNINKNNHLMTGLSSVCEDRIGGDVFAVQHKPDSLHPFYENNITRRINGIFRYESLLKNGNQFAVKGNISRYSRELSTNVNRFKGLQITFFSEASYLVKTAHHSWVTGLNLLTDHFSQDQEINLLPLDYHYITSGIFTQDDWLIGKKLTLEPGLRLDYNNKYRAFLLPRLALLYRLNQYFSGRLSGGLGYELPTPFSDEADRTRFQHVLPMHNLQAEKSSGLNLDIHFQTQLAGEMFLSVNQGFFTTRIRHPVIVNQDSLQYQTIFYENGTGDIVSKGMSTNISLRVDEMELYVDYTWLDARKQYDNNLPLELSPKNRLTSTVTWEEEESGIRLALEAFYFGRQYRETGDRTPSYWLLGASVQKNFRHFSLVANVENFLNVRQTRYENIVHPPLSNPVFNEIYAPLDGIVANIVLLFNLF